MNNDNMNPQNNGQQPQYQVPQQPQYQVPQQPQYQTPQQGYQQPNGYPQYTARDPRDGRGFSIAALVIGCCGVVFCWVGILNMLILTCGIIAIIMGAKGRKKSILAYGKPSGLATAGLVLGIIGTALSGIGVVSCLACIGCSSCTACGIAEGIGSAFYY